MFACSLTVPVRTSYDRGHYEIEADLAQSG